MMLKKLINWATNLKVAIVLLIIIALTSAIGTAIPQNEPIQNYIEKYDKSPIFGIIKGNIVINLQLDHIYSSFWFLLLLFWLGLSLILCSWRRQLPSLKTSLKWIDYAKPKQLKRFPIAETIVLENTSKGFNNLSYYLNLKGWEVNKKKDRLAARKGLVGKTGPIIVHFGLIVLMIGSTLSAIDGQKIERFISIGETFNLLNRNGENEISITLKDFSVQRDPAGRAEQFRSRILYESNRNHEKDIKDISVNHPFRFKGMTLYQADWGLNKIILQVGSNKEVELPLSTFPDLGDQVWGIVLPTSTDGGNRILLSMFSEEGPVEVFDQNGNSIGRLRPGGPAADIKGIKLKVINITTESGLLLKRDPGVPIVYTGFGITLIGGFLSIISTSQLWVIIDHEQSSIHIGGKANRNPYWLSNEMANFFKAILES